MWEGAWVEEEDKAVQSLIPDDDKLVEPNRTAKGKDGCMSRHFYAPLHK